MVDIAKNLPGNYNNVGTQIVRNVILNMNFNSFYNQTIIKGVQSPENKNLFSQEKEENSAISHYLDFTDSLLFDLLSILLHYSM